MNLVISLIIFLFVGCPNAFGEPVGNKAPPLDDRIKIDGPSPAAVTNAARPRITLALGGGGCKCIADVGVLRVFEENHIPIDFIVGTSAGATIGALYASGVSVDRIEALLVDGTIQKAMVPPIAPRIVFDPIAKLFRIGRKKPYAGLTNGNRLVKLLHKEVPSTFAETKIPFAAVATDLESGDTVMITKGDLATGVLASAALPPLVRPVELDGHLFADGGIKANLPANCAQLTKADMIVAVLTDAKIKHVDKQDFTKLKAVATRVTDLMEAAIDRQYLKETDVLIFPDCTDTPMITKDPRLVKRTIEAGVTAARQVIPAIKKKLAADGILPN